MAEFPVNRAKVLENTDQKMRFCPVSSRGRKPYLQKMWGGISQQMLIIGSQLNQQHLAFFCGNAPQSPLGYTCFFL